VSLTRAHHAAEEIGNCRLFLRSLCLASLVGFLAAPEPFPLAGRLHDAGHGQGGLLLRQPAAAERVGDDASNGEP
jgi:hypothetical protein